MAALREWFRRLLGTLWRTPRDHELHEELTLHVALAEEEIRRQGGSPGDAVRVARLHAGGIAQAMEEMRDQRGVPWLEDLARDLRHGVRTLLRQPAFPAVVVLTLGIGVGGSAAIFGAVNGILLKPLPYPDADRVLTVWQHNRRTGNDREEATPANFLDWRERSRAFERLTAMEPFGLDWLSPEGPVYLPTWLVYEGFFDVFRTRPLLGRTLHPDEHGPGRGDVVILGYNLWRSRFAGAEDVVGRVLTLDGRPHTVVGVMPEGFAIPNDDEVWAPKVAQGWEKDNRTSSFYRVFGRLRAGTGVSEARADLDAVAAQLTREYPRTNALTGTAVVPLPEQIVGRVRTALWLLAGAVVLVLAVVAASIASMQFARAVARGQEFAVRAALGANQWRVARQLAAENLLLAAVATGLGFVSARIALNGIRALAPADLPRIIELRADTDVLAFAAALSLLLALSTGIVPMFLARRAQIQTTPSSGERHITGGRVMARTQSALVILQFCATLILLVGAGLLIRSFAAVLDQPAGFRTDGVVVLTVQTWNDYREGPARANFVRQVLERLSSQPGIAAAGMTSSVPLMATIGAELAPVTIEGGPPRAEGEAPPMVHFTVTAGDLFEVFSIPVLKGRLFETRDDTRSAPVAIINEAFAKQLFPDADPIGRRIVLGGAAAGPRGPGPMGREIVGVVGNVRRVALQEAPRPGVYIPHAQAATGANAFIVRGAAPAAELLQQTKRTIWQFNPTLPPYGETTMVDLVGASVRDRRFLQVLLTAFAALALALAAGGIFGLMSFVTARRTREFGVRLALGAPRGELARGVLMRGLALAAVGISFGLLGALGLTRALTSMLYEVTPFDPLTFTAAALTLCATAAVASLYPAARAARINPSQVLQNE